MEIIHSTHCPHECVKLYLDLGFNRIDLESLGGEEGDFLISPKETVMVRITKAPEDRITSH